MGIFVSADLYSECHGLVELREQGQRVVQGFAGQVLTSKKLIVIAKWCVKAKSIVKSYLDVVRSISFRVIAVREKWYGQNVVILVLNGVTRQR